MELQKSGRANAITNLCDYKARKKKPPVRSPAPPGDPLTSAAFHLMMAVKALKTLSS